MVTVNFAFTFLFILAGFIHIYTCKYIFIFYQLNSTNIAKARKS